MRHRRSTWRSRPHTADVIGFQIDFVWSCLDPRRYEFTHGNETVISAESRFIGEDYGPVPGFRYTARQNSFTLHDGHAPYRFPLLRSHSGGNWHWEVLHTHWQRQPHVINWLRRQKKFSPNVWDDTFRKTIWHKLQAVTREDLRQFAREWAKQMKIENQNAA